jgi:hypothetical protein
MVVGLFLFTPGRPGNSKGPPLQDEKGLLFDKGILVERPEEQELRLKPDDTPIRRP